MKTILLLLIIIADVGCISQTDKKNVPESTVSSLDSPQNYDDTLRELENLSTILNYDSLGQVISTIQFDVETDNLKDFENGKIPWIRIDSPQVDIKKLIGKDEIVIPGSNVTVIIDYPLSTSYKFRILSKSGFTRTQLINEISKHYYLLYDEEERTATIKTVPQKERKIYNRNQTNGKHGIWGHDIGDLVLDKVHVYKNATGEVFLILQIQS